MDFILKHRLILLGVVIGALGGYLYYHYVGCAGGTCAITSKPMNSALYGAMMGGLFFNIFQQDKSKNQ